MNFNFRKKKKSHAPKIIFGILGVAAVSVAVSYLFESERVQQLTTDLKAMAAKQSN
ncbi:hypothetical protein BH09BAC3_BH09BAC3_19400 [soil metagenome]